MKKYIQVTVCVVFVLSVTMFMKTHNQIMNFKKDPALEKIAMDYQTNRTDEELYKYLKTPSPYRQITSVDQKFSQAYQDEVVNKILAKDGGFFIEMGASNGVQFSNTLWLERKHKWTGLLIEANPWLCSQIDKVQRSAWRLCSCISKNKTLTFLTDGHSGKAKYGVDDEYFKFFNLNNEITVPCFTLQRVLREINIHKIDYFSLDVEGAEMLVLDTIKDDLKSEKIVVGVWTIEYRVYDGKNNKHLKSKINLAKLKQFFRDVGGYMEHSQLDNEFPLNQVIPDGESLDVVFVNIKIWCATRTELPDRSDCTNHS